MNNQDVINTDHPSPDAMLAIVASCLTTQEHQKTHSLASNETTLEKDPSSACCFDSNNDDTHFPLRICQVAGRGRGFFATRDISANETVLTAAPLAWTVSSEWIKQVCMWCFAFDDRRVHPVKAATMHNTSSSAIPSNANTGKRGRKDKTKSSQPTHYKGTFCCQDCKQSAIGAFGGLLNWERFISLLGNIEREIRHINQQGFDTLNNYAGQVDDCRNSTISMDERTSINDSISIMSNLCILDDADFDPEDVTDEQLERWIDLVWDQMTKSYRYVADCLDNSHYDLIRLIANELCIHNAALRVTATGHVDQNCITTRDTSARNVAPADFLESVKNNETDVFRAWLHQIQTKMIQTTDSVSPPATIAPIRLPRHPTMSQIINSQWAEVFRVPVAMFRLLNRAWISTEQTHNLPNLLTHGRFRGIYYREKANSFGIWDPSSHTSAGECTNGTYEHQEMEWLGFAIYPTAVYFNHSCAPNVRKIRSGRKLSFVSNRDIKCGEELFISYGSITEPAPERRARLLEHFLFLCSCERCLIETS